MNPTFFSVGYHKGEMDFSVSSLVRELSYDEMRSLREMIVVGIGTMESMWREAQPQPATGTAEKAEGTT